MAFEYGIVRMYRTTTTMDTSSTNATSVYIVISETMTISNGNWVSVEEPPPRPPDYVAILPRVLPEYGGHSQLAVGRSILAKLPRGRLTRWKSLKEKRLAWGL